MSTIPTSIFLKLEEDNPSKRVLRLHLLGITFTLYLLVVWCGNGTNYLKLPFSFTLIFYHHCPRKCIMSTSQENNRGPVG